MGSWDVPAGKGNAKPLSTGKGLSCCPALREHTEPRQCWERMRYPREHQGVRKRQREGRTRLPHPCLGPHGFSDIDGSRIASQLPSSATPKFTNLEVHRALLLDHSCLLQLLLGVHLPRLLGLQRNTWSTPSGAEQPPLPQQDQVTLGDSVVTLRAVPQCGDSSCFGQRDGTDRGPIQGCANPMDLSCIPSPAFSWAQPSSTGLAGCTSFYLCSPGVKIKEKKRGKKEEENKRIKK